MIRINLLPASRKQTKTSSGGGVTDNTWYLVYAAAAAVMAIVCLLLHLSAQSEYDEQVSQNQRLQGEVSEAERRSAGLAEAEAALARSQSLEAVVTELQRARFGPTRVMMELARVLSEGGGRPSIHVSSSACSATIRSPGSTPRGTRDASG